MELTGHAVQRCSQRGIRKQQIEWLINFGCHTWNRGAKVYFFDRPHYQRLLLRLSAADRQLAEKTRNGYVVVRDQQVITVGIGKPCSVPVSPVPIISVGWTGGTGRRGRPESAIKS